MLKFIIGLTGSLGSGCTTIAKHLEEKENYKRISISQDILLPWANLEDTKFIKIEDKQIFGNFVRKEERPNYRKNLLDLIKKKLTEGINKDGKKYNKIVIECFRNPIEIDMLRNEYPHFYLMALYSPKVERRERKKCPEWFDKADKRDAGEKDNKYGQQVRKCVNQADIIIDNSMHWKTYDDTDEFFKKLNSYIELLQSPYRAPNEEEMIMHLAYSISLNSLCIQRQVGAIITDNEYNVLSVGYNAPPQKSDSCYHLYSQCFRKIKKKESFTDYNGFWGANFFRNFFMTFV